MIEHYIPLKLTHDEMVRMRDQYTRMVDLQTQDPPLTSDTYRDLWELESAFGDYDWLIARIVNATEAV